MTEENEGQEAAPTHESNLALQVRNLEQYEEAPGRLVRVTYVSHGHRHTIPVRLRRVDVFGIVVEQMTRHGQYSPFPTLIPFVGKDTGIQTIEVITGRNNQEHICHRVYSNPKITDSYHA